jgi:hypothetical protein
MAKLTIIVHCGCGHADQLEAATDSTTMAAVLKTATQRLRESIEHTQHTGHTLEFHGEVRSDPKSLDYQPARRRVVPRDVI